ncbi:biotin transporter BioY [Alkalihalobacillus trypoxylicola]|uniref:Biotin transporter n=1 Tax=Alkalihalobacillus trypoxylicola TaxID=519424 RepID=A0A162ER50_9BACI|nr:biotin transporter BioY [Alkalihalobacillus trypoxylicola]KYG33517.1 BioY family transporter [Alkalihalobacillus trypoxylicola]
MKSKQPLKTYDLAIIPVFVALLAIGANATAMIVIGGVPITFQTFIAILAGAILGSKRGIYAIIVYILVGLIGFPVFSQFHSGLGVLFRPTFGFILSFIGVVYITAKVIEKSKQKSLLTFLIACYLGLIFNYLFGTTYMYYSYQFLAELDAITYSMAWGWMIAPGIKDLIFTFFAAIIAQRLYSMVYRKSAEPIKEVA